MSVNANGPRDAVLRKVDHVMAQSECSLIINQQASVDIESTSGMITEWLAR